MSTLTDYTNRGWLIVSQSSDGVQLRKPKQWNKPLLIVGLITSVFGFGLLILILAAVDYVIKSEKQVYYTDLTNLPAPPSDWGRPMITGLLLIAIVTVCVVCVVFGQPPA